MSLKVQVTPTRRFDETPTPAAFASRRPRLALDPPSSKDAALYYLHEPLDAGKAPRPRSWPVKLRTRGLLAATWAPRTAVVTGGRLDVVTKKGVSVAVLALVGATVDPAAPGPKRDQPAVAVTDATGKTCVLLPLEDPQGFARSLARRAAERTFDAQPVVEVAARERLADAADARPAADDARSAVDGLTAADLRSLSRDDLGVLLSEYEAHLSLDQRNVVADIIAGFDTDDDDEGPATPRPRPRRVTATADSVEEVFRLANAAPTRGAVASGALAFARTPPLVKCMRAMSSHDDAAAGPTAEPCGAYRVDLTAPTHTICVCGHPKNAHGGLGSGARGGRIAAVSRAYEDALRGATERARLEEALQRARAPDEIASLGAALAAAAEAPGAASGVLPPTIVNVSGTRGAVRIQISSRRRGGARPPLRYVVVAGGAALPTDAAAWTRAPSGKAVHEVATRQRVLVAAVSVVDGVRSAVATAYFTRDDAPFLFHESHPRELEGLAPGDPVPACATCAAVVGDGGYKSLGGAEGLCAACAATGRSVGVDVGARRLWLSEPVAFKGNAADILDASVVLVDLVAKALAAHPGISIRVEGHTNSICGLDCDGVDACPCLRSLPKNRRDAFRAGGGAVGFSRARADAVCDVIRGRGVAADRLEAVGMAGARRLCDDTEGAHNAKNRRVEIHCA